jgi:acyl-coenzyme A thioesterase PaaI-like protein
MTWVCAVQAKRFAYCAELNVRYLQAVRPGLPVVATAELVANRRGRLFEAKAELRDQAGEVLATAAGKYLPLKDADAANMKPDFIGDLSWLCESIPPTRR